MMMTLHLVGGRVDQFTHGRPSGRETSERALQRQPHRPVARAIRIDHRRADRRPHRAWIRLDIGLGEHPLRVDELSRRPIAVTVDGGCDNARRGRRHVRRSTAGAQLGRIQAQSRDRASRLISPRAMNPTDRLLHTAR